MFNIFWYIAKERKKKVVFEIDYVDFGCLLSKTVKIISIGKKCAHFATYTWYGSICEKWNEHISSWQSIDRNNGTRTWVCKHELKSAHTIHIRSLNSKAQSQTQYDVHWSRKLWINNNGNNSNNQTKNRKQKKIECTVHTHTHIRKLHYRYQSL